MIWFFISLLAIGGFAALGPAEKSLGTNVRVVYLHGAWVWTALVGLILAAISGLAGFTGVSPITNQAGHDRSGDVRRHLSNKWHYWSRALGRTGLFFWITYLPISLWAMQTNWNGLFLAEPRWRVALVFSIGGLILQLGVTLLEDPRWASGANIVYISVLFLALRNTEQVMHPPSPILNSDAWRIQVFFGGLTLLTFLAASQMVRWWRQCEPA